MNNGLLFFPSSSGSSSSGGGGSLPCFAKTMTVGPLTGGVPTTITHNIGASNYQLQLNNGSIPVVVDTYIKPDPANPTTAIIIQSSVDVLAPLFVTIIGY